MLIINLQKNIAERIYFENYELLHIMKHGVYYYYFFYNFQLGLPDNWYLRVI